MKKLLCVVLPLAALLQGCISSGWVEKNKQTGTGTYRYVNRAESRQPWALYRGGFSGDKFDGRGVLNIYRGEMTYLWNTRLETTWQNGALKNGAEAVFSRGKTTISGTLTYKPVEGNAYWWGAYGFEGDATVWFENGIKYHGQVKNIARIFPAYYTERAVIFSLNRMLGTKISGRGTVELPDGRRFEGIFAESFIFVTVVDGIHEDLGSYFIRDELKAYGTLTLQDGSTKVGYLELDWGDYRDKSLGQDIAIRFSEGDRAAFEKSALVALQQNVKGEEYDKSVVRNDRAAENQARIERERSLRESEMAFQAQFAQYQSALIANATIDQINYANAVNSINREIREENRSRNASAGSDHSDGERSERPRDQSGRQGTAANASGGNDSGDRLMLTRGEASRPAAAEPADKVVPTSPYQLESEGYSPAGEADACAWAKATAVAGNRYSDDESLRKYGGVPTSSMSECSCTDRTFSLTGKDSSHDYKCVVKYTKWSAVPIDTTPRPEYRGGGTVAK